VREVAQEIIKTEWVGNGHWKGHLRIWGFGRIKQMSIKLAMNRFWVVSKLLNCAVTFIVLTRHHTTHKHRYWLYSNV
jgi:hypothetical protein